MNNLDKKIICMLEKNCRTPFSQIAKQLRVSRTVVAYRVNNLKKSGIIKKYITSVDLGKLGYSTYKIYFKIQGFNKESELIDYLQVKKEIIHLIKLEGEYNLSCVIVAKNIVDVDAFLTELKTKFESVIKAFQISIIVYSKIFKLEKILLGQKKQIVKFEKYSSEEKPIKLDENDKHILHILSQEANLSYINLMKKTNLTLDIIKYRMKKLKQSVISSFRLIFDLNKLGYFHYVILLKTNNMTKKDEEKLVTWATVENNVMYFTKRIGQYDFEINVAIANIADLKKITRKIQSEFANKIDSYGNIFVSDILKLNYVPF